MNVLMGGVGLEAHTGNPKATGAAHSYTFLKISVPGAIKNSGYFCSAYNHIMSS